MISKRIYITIFILMLMVLVMFMFEGVTSKFLSDPYTNTLGEKRTGIDQEKMITAASLNLDSQAYTRQKLQVAILSGGSEDKVLNHLIEWCVYNKHQYRIYTDCPDQEAIAEYEVILFGEYKLREQDYELLDAYAELGKTMIFTQAPDSQDINNNNRLAYFMGIKDVRSDGIEADGIKIFPNFMISEERIYIQDDFYGEEDDTIINIPYYNLRPGYEVYSVAMLEDQKELGDREEELPPLLWRTSTKNAFVFVVNSDIFNGVSLLGILTGFMSQSKECYLYPIVNAQTISLLNYPYYSDENTAEVNHYYSRSSKALARDLLWPNIIQVLKSYGNTYSFFAAPQLDYQDDISPSMQYADFYLREISSLPGAIGLSLGQNSEAALEDIISESKKFFGKSLKDYENLALYLADFKEEEIVGALGDELFENIHLVMSDYEEGDNLIDLINDDIVNVKFNLNGYQHETLDDIQMICIENAIGMCNSKVDIGQVFYPEEGDALWNDLSIKWSRGSTYFNDFDQFDMVSVYEMEKRVRRFLALDYTYERNENRIDINIDQFEEEAYFILSVYGFRVEDVENGSAELISGNNYIIKAVDAEVSIHLQEENKLEKPRNQKLIPINP